MEVLRDLLVYFVVPGGKGGSGEVGDTVSFYPSPKFNDLHPSIIRSNENYPGS